MMRYFQTALSVRSLAASRAFYQKLFDLKFRAEGERKELKVRFVQLQDANGNVIELFEHENPLPLEENLMDFQRVGLKHIAFVADNLETTLEKAVANGAKVLWPITKGITVKRLTFIADPDGIPIELVEL